MLGPVSKAVDLARLADALRDYRFAYLITVDDDYRAHTTTVTPVFADGVLNLGPVGRHGRANLSERRGVTLVWPSRDVNDYSLIVDGDAELPDDPADSVHVRPTRALLHRPVLDDGTAPAAGYVYDCVVLSKT
jgi:hypothetical protein